MTTRVPAKYQLLIGPNRLALWATLSRFKRRCVENCIASFFEDVILPTSSEAGKKFRIRESHVNAVTAAHHSLQNALDSFLSRREYEKRLAKNIRTLIGEADIDDRWTLETIDVNEVARIRVGDLAFYLRQTVETWRALRISSESLSTNPDAVKLIEFWGQLYGAVAQTFWPYYGIVYERHKDSLPNEGSRFNLASWLPNAELSSVGIRSHMETDILEVLAGRTERRGERVSGSLLLYPSLTAEGLVNTALRAVIDAASSAPFDLDMPKGVAGHVQVLRNLEASDQRSRPIDRLFIDQPIESPFTDLFYFVNDAMRCIIRPASGSVDPQGVLYLAGPSLDVLSAIVSKSGTTTAPNAVANLARASWEDVGGIAISNSLHRDFKEWREKYLPALGAQDQLFAYQSIGHTMNSLVRITGWQSSRDSLRKARQKMRALGNSVANAADFKEICQAVEAAHRSLGMFVLPQSMDQVIRFASDVQDRNWMRFADWIDDQHVRWDEQNIESICGIYARSIFELARSICAGCDPFPWHELVVECGRAAPSVRRLTWNGEDDEWSESFFQSLHFPPFKKGSSASYLFIFALTEPICNGITALVKHRQHQLRQARARGNGPAEMINTALRITISPNIRQRQMRVVIDNVSLGRAQTVIPGVGKTKLMLADFDLVTFEDCQCTPVPAANNQFEVSSALVFHPFKLHDRLVGHAGE